MPKNKEWTMPDWMEPYRESITNHGGNSIESCMNGNAGPFVNLPLFTIQTMVKAQVALLTVLHSEGKLRPGKGLWAVRWTA